MLKNQKLCIILPIARLFQMRYICCCKEVINETDN